MDCRLEAMDPMKRKEINPERECDYFEIWKLYP